MSQSQSLDKFDGPHATEHHSSPKDLEADITQCQVYHEWYGGEAHTHKLSDLDRSLYPSADEMSYFKTDEGHGKLLERSHETLIYPRVVQCVNHEGKMDELGKPLHCDDSIHYLVEGHRYNQSCPLCPGSLLPVPKPNEASAVEYPETCYKVYMDQVLSWGWKRESPDDDEEEAAVGEGMIDRYFSISSNYEELKAGEVAPMKLQFHLYPTIKKRNAEGIEREIEENCCEVRGTWREILRVVRCAEHQDENGPLCPSPGYREATWAWNCEHGCWDVMGEEPANIRKYLNVLEPNAPPSRPSTRASSSCYNGISEDDNPTVDPPPGSLDGFARRSPSPREADLALDGTCDEIAEKVHPRFQIWLDIMARAGRSFYYVNGSSEEEVSQDS